MSRTFRKESYQEFYVFLVVLSLGYQQFDKIKILERAI